MIPLTQPVDDVTALWLFAIAAALIGFLLVWYFAAHQVQDFALNSKLLREYYVTIALCAGGIVFAGAFVFYLFELSVIVNTAVNTLERVANAPTATEEDASSTFQNYATGIAALLATLAAAATLAFQLIRVWINERTASTAENVLLSDRMRAATEQLGSNSIPVRIGGLLALRRLIDESPDDADLLRATVNEYLLYEAKAGEAQSPAGAKLRSDLQVALEIMTGKR